MASTKASRRRGRPTRRKARRAQSDVLTDQQERFCQDYLVHLNAARAYRSAYPEATAATADTNGPRLLGNARVRARIEDLMLARAARTEITQDRVVQELAAIAFARHDWFEVDAYGQLRAKPGIPAEALAAISSVKKTILLSGKKTKVLKVEFRLWDKPKALNLTGLHLGMFVRKHKHEIETKNGVLVLPAGVSTEQWLVTAAQQQADLVKQAAAAAAGAG